MGEEAVQPDLRCFRCGYSLAGIHADSVCPECGFSVTLSTSPAGRVCSVVPVIATARNQLLWMFLLDCGAFISLAGTVAAFAAEARSPAPPTIPFGAYLFCNLLCAMVSLRFAASLRSDRVVRRSFKLGRIALALTCWFRVLAIVSVALLWFNGQTGSFPIFGVLIVLSGPFEWMTRVGMLRAIRRLDSEAGWGGSKEGFEAFLVLSIAWTVLGGTWLLSWFVRFESPGIFGALWMLCGLVMAILALNLTVRTRQFLRKMGAAFVEAAHSGSAAEGVRRS